MLRVFVKISGDLFQNNKVLNLISKYSKNKSVVVCVGGGTQINQAFIKAGITPAKHGPLGREHRSDNERKIAEKILEANRKNAQMIFKKIKIKAKVISPIIEIGKIRCHINGDQMVLAAYLGFDELFILTTKDRLKKKRFEFKKYKKVKVVGF